MRRYGILEVNKSMEVAGLLYYEEYGGAVRADHQMLLQATGQRNLIISQTHKRSRELFKLGTKFTNIMSPGGDLKNING